MALSAGTRLGPYEITGEIGAGGMGVVYEATDTRLNRTVAVKVLPDHISGQEDIKARFEREAQAIAGMSHPNICTLHDVGHETPVVPGRSVLGDAEGTGDGEAAAAGSAGEAPGADGVAIDFLVMEYLEGSTLEQRLRRGAMPLAEALKVGIAIADALDKAHKQGIVHRDLKPANIMLTESGPKLLDFGLAKHDESGEHDLRSAIATRADITAQGTLIGTMQYMAPEQVEGKPADARTDIFAFGAVLYEMVTGKKAFEGTTQTTLITAIMNRDPRPISELVSVSPPALEHFLERCLMKEPENRWQSAHSLVLQLQWILYGGAESGAGEEPVEETTTRQWLTGAGVAVAAIVLAVLAVSMLVSVFTGAPAEAIAYRSPIRGLSGDSIAVSPDGEWLALVASPALQGTSSLFIRGSRAINSRELAGTQNATHPFWSPDSRFVAFVAGGKLRKIAAAGGPVQDIVDVADFSGGTWNEAGTIVFGSSQGLFRVSAEGGTAEQLTVAEEPETGHFWPHFLPDGQRFLYLAWSDDSTSRRVYTSVLDSTDRTELLAVESNVAYADPGYLLFHREATVFARPFDPGSLAFMGEEVRVAGEVSFSSGNGRGNFDVSQTGVFLYFEGETSTGGSGRGNFTTSNASLAWVGRDGALLERTGEPAWWGDFDVSPDDALIAASRADGPSTPGDIWIIDWQRSVHTRLTRDESDDLDPVWSHDGTRVAFTTYRNGNADVFVKNAQNIGDAEPLLSSSSNEKVEDWSRDGRYLAYLLDESGFSNIWILPLGDDGDEEPFLLVGGSYHKDEPQFSDDGNWLSYTSDESGTFEVYVMSFPEGDQRQQVSTNGGGQPRWAPDGTELYYRDLEGQIMVVPMRLDTRLGVESPELLFRPGYQGRAVSDPQRHVFSVGSAGDRFLIRVGAPGFFGGGGGRRGGVPVAPTFVTPTGGGATPVANNVRAAFSDGLTVILDWPAAVRGTGQ